MSAAFALAMTAAVSSQPIGISFWKSGDDGLTNRFGEALQADLVASGHFRLAAGNEPAAFAAELDAVQPRSGRDGYDYAITLSAGGSPNGRRVAHVRGSCDNYEIEPCAAAAASRLDRAVPR
jgi:hypothetical protein